jgi:hypothetical protein
MDSSTGAQEQLYWWKGAYYVKRNDQFVPYDGSGANHNNQVQPQQQAQVQSQQSQVQATDNGASGVGAQQQHEQLYSWGGQYFVVRDGKFVPYTAQQTHTAVAGATTPTGTLSPREMEPENEPGTPLQEPATTPTSVIVNQQAEQNQQLYFYGGHYYYLDNALNEYKP